jgi:hypothetical protein
MAVGKSADPVAIQQFSHALQELSITPDVCREITVPNVIVLLPTQYFSNDKVMSITL